MELVVAFCWAFIPKIAVHFLFSIFVNLVLSEDFKLQLYHKAEMDKHKIMHGWTDVIQMLLVRFMNLNYFFIFNLMHYPSGHLGSLQYN